MAAGSAVVQIGIPAASQKSYTYDNASYVQPDPVQATLGSAAIQWKTGTATVISTNYVSIVAFTTKVLKSVTIVPTSTPSSGGDTLIMTLTSLQGGQQYGTSTLVTTTAYTSNVGPLLGTSGVVGTATGSNITTIVGQLGTLQIPGYGGGTVGTGTSAFVQIGTSQAIFNPLYIPISGGTYTVVTSNVTGQATATNVTFGKGPLGGLLLFPGDVLTVSKSTTDTTAVYQIEAEFAFTPGTLFTL